MRNKTDAATKRVPYPTIMSDAYMNLEKSSKIYEETLGKNGTYLCKIYIPVSKTHTQVQIT